MIKVSVCVCTYKRNELLFELLISLCHQDYKRKYNIIVVDNSSEFGSEELILNFNKKYNSMNHVTFIFKSNL